MKITPINSSDSDWTTERYILSFGAYGDVHLMVWADSLEGALDECIDWLAANTSGLLCTDEVNEEYDRLIALGQSIEEAHEGAEMDTTCGGNAGNYIHSWEWALHAENPTRAEMLEMQAR